MKAGTSEKVNMSKKKKDIPQISAEEMMTKNFINGVHEVADFLLSRYPYLCAVLMMVTTPEEVKHMKNKKVDFQLIYCHLALYFFTGTLMSFNMFGLKRFSAFIMAIQLAVISFEEFTSGKNDTVVARLVFRNLGCIGCYLMVAGGLEKDKKRFDQNHRLLKIGRQIIGAYIVIMAILLLNNKTEFITHVHLLPGGYYTTWILLVCYFFLGICIDYGIFVSSCCKIIILLLFFVTILVDLDTDMWLKSGRIHQWKAMTIAARHIPVVGVMMLIRKKYY